MNPSVTQTIEVTLEGKTFKLTKSEAEKLQKQLNDVLGGGHQWPIVIERPVYRESHRPWIDPNKIMCSAPIPMRLTSGSEVH